MRCRICRVKWALEIADKQICYLTLGRVEKRVGELIEWVQRLAGDNQLIREMCIWHRTKTVTKEMQVIRGRMSLMIGRLNNVKGEKKDGTNRQNADGDVSRILRAMEKGAGHCK